jgi:hypothetical protein
MDIYNKGQMNDFQMGDKGLVKGSRHEIIMGPKLWKRRKCRTTYGILEKTGKNVGQQQKTIK